MAVITQQQHGRTLLYSDKDLDLPCGDAQTGEEVIHHSPPEGRPAEVPLLINKRAVQRDRRSSEQQRNVDPMHALGELAQAAQGKQRILGLRRLGSGVRSSVFGYGHKGVSPLRRVRDGRLGSTHQLEQNAPATRDSRQGGIDT